MLIRLPDLNESPEKEKAIERTGRTDQDAPAGAQEPGVKPSVDGERVEGERDDRKTRTLSRKRDPEATRGTQDEPSTQTETNLLRAVLQGAIAVALIGTFITVYVLIVDGRGSDAGDEITGDQGAIGFPENESSIEQSEPGDFAIVPPISGAEPAEQSFDGTLPKDETPGFQNAPTTPRSPLVGTARATGRLTEGDQQSATPHSSRQVGVGPQDAVSGSQPSALPNQERKGGSAGAEKMSPPGYPSTGLSLPDQPENAPSYKYPVTKPSTYQYPKDYHTRLRGVADLNDARGTSSVSDRRSGYGGNGGQPSTARLQPSIQPPSYR